MLPMILPDSEVSPVDLTSLCSCHITTVPTPGGEIVLVRVFGDIDLTSMHVLVAALADARARHPSHLVVDVAGLGFCSAQGLALLVDGGTEAPGGRTRHVLSGARPRIGHYLDLLWMPADLPVRHSTAGSAVLAAMADQRRRHTAAARATRPGPRAVPDPGPPDDVAADVPDLELTTRARAGDGEAYRALARRHRTRMYRSALQMLGAAEDPADVAEDIADDITTRLRMALVAFGAASPP